MANIFKISQATPLKWHPLSVIWNSQELSSDTSLYSFNNQYNHRHFDFDFWQKNLQSWADKATYYKPFQKNDCIYETFEGLEQDGSLQYIFRLCTPCGNLVKEVNCTEVAQIGSSVQYIWKYSMSLHDVPEGIYICQLWHLPEVSGDADYILVAEPIEVKAYHEGTVLIKYKNSYNDQDIFFEETDITFQSRYFAHIGTFSPNSTRHTYTDEPKNLTLLSAITAREWVINFKRVPDYELDKISRIFDCDTKYFDGIRYEVAEGVKLEINREKNSPLSECSMQIQEAENAVSLVQQNLPEIICCDAPLTRRFYVNSYTIPSFAVTNDLEKHFEGINSFLGYLNNVLFTLIEGSYFTVNAHNKIVLICGDSTTYAIYEDMTFNDILPYWMSFDLNAGASLEIDTTNSSAIDYAFDNGNGTAMAMLNSASFTVSSTTTTGTATAYLFLEDAESIDLAPTVYGSLRAVDGDLPPSLQFLGLSSQEMSEVKGNMFMFCNGSLQNVFLDGNAFDTNMINVIIMWFFDAYNNGAFDTTSIVDIDTQIPFGSPPLTSDSGLLSMINFLKANGVTLTTD